MEDTEEFGDPVLEEALEEVNGEDEDDDDDDDEALVGILMGQGAEATAFSAGAAVTTLFMGTFAGAGATDVLRDSDNDDDDDDDERKKSKKPRRF